MTKMGRRMKRVLALCAVGLVVFAALSESRAADKDVSQLPAESDAKLELTEDGLIQVRHQGQGSVFIDQSGLGLIVDFPSGKGIGYSFEDFTLLDRYLDRYRPAISSTLDGEDDLDLDLDEVVDVRFYGEVTLVQLGDGYKLEIEIMLNEAMEDFDRDEKVFLTVKFLTPEIILPKVKEDVSFIGDNPPSMAADGDCNPPNCCAGGSCNCTGTGGGSASACCRAGTRPSCDCTGQGCCEGRCLENRRKRHLELIEFNNGPQESEGP